MNKYLRKRERAVLRKTRTNEKASKRYINSHVKHVLNAYTSGENTVQIHIHKHFGKGYSIMFIRIADALYDRITHFWYRCSPIDSSSYTISFYPYDGFKKYNKKKEEE